MGSPSARGRRPLLEIGRIYHEPNVGEYARGHEILARFPDAERIEVPSQSFARERGVSEELDSVFP